MTEVNYGKKKERYSETKSKQNFDGNLVDQQATFTAQRPDGTINTHPQERMRASSEEE